MADKNSFLVYKDIDVEGLDDNQLGQLFRAMLDYANEREVEIEDPEVRGLWRAVKRQMYPEKRDERNTTAYHHWRKAVLERDDYTCQLCGKHGGRLNVHHIKPFSLFPRDRLKLENGITLCEECHKRVHRNHG